MAAACGALDHIFEQPLLENNQSLLDSLSPSNQVRPEKFVDDSSFTEIVGELHFNEKSQDDASFRIRTTMFESLSLCTEGLGFESFDDKQGSCNEDWRKPEEGESGACARTSAEKSLKQKRSATWKREELPPPISSIGRDGKPWIRFNGYRENGRFILKETRIPTRELLHAFRENGCLKLQMVQSDDEQEEEEAHSHEISSLHLP